MAITLNGTTGITTPDITSTAGFDSADLTGDIAAARITTALNATGSAPIYAARAWVNFNGTGTVAIRASGNVSSITDNGTGDYTVNFTAAMTDANYSAIATSTNTGVGYGAYAVGYESVRARTVASWSFWTGSSTALQDTGFNNVAIFR
jgi:hypothetical protein